MAWRLRVSEGTLQLLQHALAPAGCKAKAPLTVLYLRCRILRSASALRWKMGARTCSQASTPHSCKPQCTGAL